MIYTVTFLSRGRLSVGSDRRVSGRRRRLPDARCRLVLAAAVAEGGEGVSVITVVASSDHLCF